MPVQVTIDDRERGAELAASIARQLGRAPVVARLELGDIAIGDVYLIERKTAPDFVASLLDKRLPSQLDRLAKLKNIRPIVIVEGPFNQMVLGGMNPGDVRQAMLEIQLDWRIPMIRSHDFDHTAQWIVELVRRADRATAAKMPYQPEEKAARPVSAAGKKPRASGVDAVQLTALQRVPGLGKNKAAVLMERFGSISAIKGASAKEIAELPGFSRELAEKVLAVLSQ
ncbi:hypothetical protein LLG95_03555 [bacterium]|nr:hypothetical protein [bacterium]